MCKLKIFLILLCASWAAAIKLGTSEHTDRRPLILGMDILPQEWKRNETLKSRFSPNVVTIAPLFGSQLENMSSERGVASMRSYLVNYNDTDRVSHIREESSDGVIRTKHVARRQVLQKLDDEERARETEQPMVSFQRAKLEPVMQNMTDTETVNSKNEVKSWPMSQQPFVKRIFGKLAEPLI